MTCPPAEDVCSWVQFHAGSKYGYAMLAALVAIAATLPTKFPMTVESIMRGYSLVGHAPRDLRWSPDGKELTFSWAKATGLGEPVYRHYVVNRDGTGLKYSDERNWPEKTLPPKPGRQIYVSQGDVFLRDPDSKAPKRLTTSLGADTTAALALSGDAVIYTKEGKLFRLSVSDGSSVKIADGEPDLPIIGGPNPSQAELAKEEATLFKYLPQVDSDTMTAGAPQSEKLRFSVAPSGRFAVLTRPLQPHGVRVANVPNFVTASGYTEMIPTYDKVGEPQPQSRAEIVDLKSGANFEIKPPRPWVVWRTEWSPDQKHAAMLGVSVDQKDKWIFGFDAASESVTQLWNEHDDSWIGGPGAGLLGWLPDSSAIYFESEKTGFAHLMVADPQGNDCRALTSGNFEVSRVHIAEDKQHFVFVSSAGGASRRHLDELPIAGGTPQKIADLSADDDASFAIGPNGKDIAVVRSTTNRPPELFINGIQVTHSPTDEWLEGPWTSPPIIMVPARDGVKVPARLYKPKNWKQGGPAVLFVHGAGYLQNVFDGWSYYWREFMFNHLLMEKGYAVLDMDYRGSAGYGKAWRTAIYRHMGGKDLDDEVDGANWLVKNLGVDKRRIGMYGGSYGGFMTLMAMFTQPDVFAAGAALRPVSDWANYNHWYTAAILNTPQDDPEAYRRSSPIYFANGLKGHLLICHGMIDTNVHFQDSVRLVERLIELHKKNWEVAPYPIEDHAFQRADSWTDEYSRILDLFDRTIGSGFHRSDLR